MRFLFFSAQYLPTIGGVERYTQNLAQTLQSMGHQATIVTSALPNLPHTETTPEGLRLYRLPARLLLNGRFPAPRHNKLFKQLAAQLWGGSYDFAIINTRFYLLSLWAAKQCHKRGIPAIVLEHGTKHLSLDSPLLDYCANLYEHAVMRRVRRWCPRFYGVSAACAHWLTHFGVQAEGVLYNAVNPEELRALSEQSSVHFRSRFGISGTAPLICYSGRFIREKGIGELEQAFCTLRQTLPEAVLIMAGDGPELAAMQARQAPHIFFTGPLPYADNLALLAQADVFCLPSYSEGFSTIILEAAALGSCIITTPTGGSPELISDGESGILLKNHTSATITAALHTALQNTAWRKQAGKAAAQAVAAKFTWPLTAQKLLTIAAKEN